MADINADESLERGSMPSSPAIPDARSAAPTVRFDDMSAGTTTTLTGFVRQFRATHHNEVREVLDHAERAARRGEWVAGFVAYEAAPAFDESLSVHPTMNTELPLAWFATFESARVSELALPAATEWGQPTRWQVETPREEYEHRVERIRTLIGAGDVYQVNLTTRFVSDDDVDPLALYRTLLVAQRPAHAALIVCDDFSIVSASPELFFEWDQSILRCRPMKGTHRRGRYEEEDGEFARYLRNSPKEQSENIMIVDLMRNDMAKVSRVGEVKVTALLDVETYPQVLQLVSEIESRTQPSTSLFDVFQALFPCGSVTGAPKTSAMSVIASLEEGPRGVYCGSVGLVSPHEHGYRARFNVAIRTASLTSRRREFGSGGGIVAGSDPSTEFTEMLLKARQLQPLNEEFELLETFRFTPDAARDIRDRHLRRLQRSGQMLGFEVPANLAQIVDDEIAALEVTSRIRVMVARSGRVEVQSDPLSIPDDRALQVVVDTEPVHSNDPALFHKTTRREVYESRRRRWPEVDDVILVNERGECTESTIANLALRLGPRWFTPPLSSGCLPGIARDIALENGELTTRVLRPDDLYEADAIALVNSLRGWRRAVHAGSGSVLG